MKTLFSTLLAVLLAGMALLSHAAPLPAAGDLQSTLSADEDKDKEKDKKDG